MTKQLHWLWKQICVASGNLWKRELHQTTLVLSELSGIYVYNYTVTIIICYKPFHYHWAQNANLFPDLRSFMHLFQNYFHMTTNTPVAFFFPSLITRLSNMYFYSTGIGRMNDFSHLAGTILSNPPLWFDCHWISGRHWARGFHSSHLLRFDLFFFLIPSHSFRTTKEKKQETKDSWVIKNSEH